MRLSISKAVRRHHHRRFSVTLFLDNSDKIFFLGGKNLQSKKKLKNASPLSYIDLLVLTLTQHEKGLCLIIKKLEKISDKLEEMSRELTENKKSNLSSC